MCEIQRIIGFQKNIKGGLLFSKPSTLFYFTGQTGVFYNLNSNSQDFLPIGEKNEFTAMALGGKNMLALASKGCTPKLTVYNLKSKRSFILPNADKCKNVAEYVQVSFTEDNEYLAAQGGKPSWPFIMWHIGKRCVSGVFIPFRLEIGAEVHTFSFYPRDYARVLAIGQYFFRIYHCKSENRFKEEALHKLERSQKIFHSLTWLQNTEKYAVGTSDGMILIFERKQLLQKISIEKKLESVPRIFSKIESPEDKNVTCILCSKTGIICSYGGSSILCLRWTIDRKDFNIVTLIQVPKKTEANIKGSKIVQLVLSSSEDIIAAATDHGQILTFKFPANELLDVIGYEEEFSLVMDQQHKTPVICADTAISNPVHVTCSESDIILWDYLKRESLLWKSFDDIICSVSIHPLGINLFVGFSESCKMYNILLDKLEEVLSIHSSGNTKVKFSDGGHLMAFSNAHSIEIYSYQSLEKCTELKDNDAEVTCVLWKNNDSHLLLLNKAGNVYEWDVAERKKLWSYSSHGVISAIAHFDDNIYAATSDLKIWIFNNYQKTAEIDTLAKVTNILITSDMLLAGCENGKISGYRYPYSSGTFFETNFHQKSIINMTLKLNGKLLLATGEDGAITMWEMNCDLGTSVEMRDEVLIEQELYNSLVNTITQLEKELKEKTDISERKKSELLSSQEVEKTALLKYYEDIQNQLKQKIIALTEEKYNLQLDKETTLSEKMATLSKKRDENYTDFQAKLTAEQENFKKLEDERKKKVEEYERKLLGMHEEIGNSNTKLKKIKEKNKNRLNELELLLRKEIDYGKEIAEQDRKIRKEIEEKALAKLEERKSEFASEIENIQEQTALLTSEVERYKAVLDYENECSRSLNAEFGKKKRMYDELKRITNHIKNRMNQTEEEIQRKESVIEDKVSMIKVLEHDAKELHHFSSEAKWKLEECKKQLRLKNEELWKLQSEREKLKSDQHLLSKKLKDEQREQFVMNEKSKATQKSIADSTQKLLKSQLLLERFKKEFIKTTKDIENPTALKRALLQLYEKRALRKRVKEEEVFVGDTDPFMKFCRQREHYETLINTVSNRKQEIQASFRKACVKLAKENSDWTAFAETLRSDIKQKKERIQVLETAVGLPRKDFIKDPSETQNRFNKAYEDLKLVEKLEDEEIQKRKDLIEKQTAELQRLHGLLVVEERGKIVKMGH